MFVQNHILKKTMKTLFILLLFLSISIVHSQSLRLIHPNGGEKFLLGSDILIQWEIEDTTNLVQIEFSSNNGTNWNFIDTARGTSYLWKNVAIDTANSYLIKVIQIPSSNVNYTLERTLFGHSSWVYFVKFSPDGLTLASASRDTTAVIWNVESGKVVHTLKGHSQPVASLEFSPDGNLLATTSADNTIKIWDVETGNLLRTLSGHFEWILCISFNPDGKTIASGGDDNTIKIWDVYSGELLKTFTGHTDWVRSVDFSPDGLTLVSGGEENMIIFWDVNSGQKINSVKTRSGAVRYNYDGSLIASGGFGPFGIDNTIKIIDIKTLNVIRTLSGHSAWIGDIEFSPDSKRIVSSGFDKTIKIWDAETGILLQTINGHSSAVYNATYSPNEQKIASGSADSTVKIWVNEIGADVDQSDSVFSIIDITSVNNQITKDDFLIVTQNLHAGIVDIDVNLPENGISTVKIFNVNGVMMDTKELTSAGSQKISLKTDSYSSGTYHILLTTPTRTEKASFIVVK